MSRKEVHIGKVRELVYSKDTSLEQKCEMLCMMNEKYLSETSYDSWEELLCNEMYELYIISKERIFEVLEDNEQDDYGEVIFASRNEDETIDFCVSFYNSGTSLSEAIRCAMNKL